MAVANSNYHDSHGHYPPAYVLGPDGRPWHSWRVLILPYIEQQALHNEYRFDEPWDGPNNRRLADRMPRMYAFHNAHRPGQGTTNYLAVVGPNTMWPGKDGRQSADIADGFGNTVLVVENRGLGVHWMEPRDLDLDSIPLEFNHPHGISSGYKMPAVVTANDHVMRLNPGIEPAVLRALLTASGGEPLGQVGGRAVAVPPRRPLEGRGPDVN